MSDRDSSGEKIAHELVLRSDEEAGQHVLRLFPNARCEREDNVAFWSDEEGPIAFHDIAEDGVHLLFVRRSDVATFLQLHGENAVMVLHDERVYRAYPASAIRAAVRYERAREHSAPIPLAIERHEECNSEQAILIPCERHAGDFPFLMLDEPDLALAVRQYRRRLLRVI